MTEKTVVSLELLQATNSVKDLIKMTLITKPAFSALRNLLLACLVDNHDIRRRT